MTGDTATDDPRPIELTGVLADRSRWRADACPAAAALGVVGTRSALLLMREALYGTTRFDDFAERVGVTEAVTAARLRELTAAGLLQKVPYREPGARTRHEYRLTEMGSDLAPVVLALFEWGGKYVTSRTPLHFVHGECGADVHVETVCDDGHRVTTAEIRAKVDRRSA